VPGPDTFTGAGTPRLSGHAWACLACQPNRFDNNPDPRDTQNFAPDQDTIFTNAHATFSLNNPEGRT
jgi:hypothetical protein